MSAAGGRPFPNERLFAALIIAFARRDGADPVKRPVTLTCNGCSGSSSVWLHMGAFGPKRLVYGSTANTRRAR